MEQSKKTLNKYTWGFWLGLFLVTAGILSVAYNMGAAIPGWLVSWPMAVIAVGFLMGIYHRFRAGFWLIPLFWGVYLLVELQVPSLHLGNYATPLSFILAGIIIVMIRRNHQFLQKGKFQFEKSPFINVAGFGGMTKRDVLTDNFKGADITCVLGNTVIDLQNADMQASALIDVTVFMGSAKIYIPEAWVIHNDITTVFGDIKHTRVNQSPVTQEDKVIKLDGTAVFGSIEIISC